MPDESARRDRAAAPLSVRHPVKLAIPADKTLVVLTRSVAGHLGARIGLTVQELGDLRLAIDEACALLLLPEEIGTTGDVLECRFHETDGALRITVSGQAAPDAEPHVGGFGWTLLSTLVDELDWSVSDGRAEVVIVKRARASTPDGDEPSDPQGCAEKPTNEHNATSTER